MTFQQMQCFIEVAHCKNFTRAAQRLYLSQPNLTKYIAGMEKELGVKLFERSSHYVELTPEGQSLLQKSETVFLFLKRAVDDTAAAGKTSVRCVNIGLSRDEILPEPLMPLMRQMNMTKEFLVVVEQTTYFSLFNGLIDHSYDLIFTTDRNVLHRNDMEYVPLRPFNLVLAISKSHPKASQPDLTPIDFQDEKVFIALPNGKTVPSAVVSSVFNMCGGALDLYFGDSPSDIILNASLRAGVALVSELVDQSRYPDIRFVAFEDRDNAFQYLAWRKGERSQFVLTCRDMIIDACKKVYDSGARAANR